MISRESSIIDIAISSIYTHVFLTLLTLSNVTNAKSMLTNTKASHVQSVASILDRGGESSELSAVDLPDACQSPNQTWIQAETTDLWLFICGADRPQNYVSMRKKSLETLILPLARYKSQEFVATKANKGRWGGSYLYTLTPSFLKITYYDNIVLLQKILLWQEINIKSSL